MLSDNATGKKSDYSAGGNGDVGSGQSAATGGYGPA